MEQNKTFSSGKDVNGDEWYVDNYVLLKNYYDMTISRIAARCVHSGNIAIEEYKHYAYILDVLEEISETGEYILAHSNLYPYVEKKISGGINALKSSLQDYKTELEHDATPEMIKQDADEINKVKDALGQIDKYFRVAFKPVATLLRPQETVDIKGKATTLTARGRHDPCVLPRAVPVVEAMAAMTIFDAYLMNKTAKIEEICM